MHGRETMSVYMRNAEWKTSFKYSSLSWFKLVKVKSLTLSSLASL